MKDNYFIFSGFLSTETQERLINRALHTKLYKQDSILDEQGVQIGDYRSSESVVIMVRQLRDLLSNRLKIQAERLEPAQLIRYQPGGEFRPHVDFHVEGYKGYETAIARGQRTLTFIFYINDDYEGGQLRFTDLDETIQAAAGDLVVIVNQFPDETLNWNSTHASLPIKSGTKYIILYNYVGTYDPDHLTALSNTPSYVV